MTDRLQQLLRGMGSRGSFVRLITIAIAITVAFAALMPGVFFSPATRMSVGLSSAEIILLAMAVSVAMLTGGIDLSVVATANLVGVVAGQIMRSNPTPAGVALAVLAGLAVALCCGVVNGLLVAGLNTPPILATLGTSQLFGGLALIVSNNTVLKGMPDVFLQMGSTAILGIPVILLIALVAAGAFGVFVARTTTGFRMRMIGANATSARYSGMPVAKVLLTTYALSAVLAAIAGFVIVAKTQGANPNYGSTYILLVIVIAVLAGVNPDGGYITIAGVVIATFALQILSHGLTAWFVEHQISRVSENLFSILTGVLLIGLMLAGQLLDRWSARRRERAKLAGLQRSTAVADPAASTPA